MLGYSLQHQSTMSLESLQRLRTSSAVDGGINIAVPSWTVLVWVHVRSLEMWTEIFKTAHPLH